jgi:hypothetical protein
LIASGSLEEALLLALDVTNRERLRKCHGLDVLPNRHVGCRVTAEIRDVSQSGNAAERDMAANGTPFQLQIFGHHHSDCAGKLRSIQHIDPDVEHWCLSLMRLHMSFDGVREARDAFLGDRGGFVGSIFSCMYCV